MAWPTPQDYNEALQNPHLNLADPELRAGSPELTPLGLPRAISGGFASVYRLRCNGCDWAVRCFLRDVPDQQERYAAIGQHLAVAKLPQTVGFAFQPSGIRVAGRSFPILKMAWVGGESLERWIERHLDDPAALARLADRWIALIRAMRVAGVAHGDLQHGNILVVAGEPRLIDYDGIYVPALAGRAGTEVGHRNYQHPQRGPGDFGPGIDTFAAWSIFISLRALRLQSALWGQLGAGDEALLLRREDYEQPATSPAFRALEGIAEPDFRALLGRFRGLLAQPVAALPPLPGTTPPAPTPRTVARRRHRRAAASAPRQPAPVTGAAAWLGDHLTPPAPVALAGSRRPERAVSSLVLGALLLVLLGVAGGLLPIVATALACGVVVCCGLLFLAGRYCTAPVFWQASAARARVWCLRLRLRASGWASWRLEGHLAQLAAREERLLDRLNERRHEAAREAREARAALDRSLARYAVGRQLLDRAEAEALAQALRDLRQRHAAAQLAAYPVLTAAIPGLGPQLKLRLLAAGIRTAAQIRDLQIAAVGAGGELVRIDVPGRGLVRVEGLGRKKAEALLSWRRLLEARATAALPESLPSGEEAAIRLRYHTRRERLQRREATAARTVERRKESLRAQARGARARFDREARAIRAQAAGPRDRAETELGAQQATLAASHLALALARRDRAAYDGIRFTRYLRGIVRG